MNIFLIPKYITNITNSHESISLLPQNIPQGTLHINFALKYIDLNLIDLTSKCTTLLKSQLQTSRQLYGCTAKHYHSADILCMCATFGAYSSSQFKDIHS